jgi:hypothetical protein
MRVIGRETLDPKRFGLNPQGATGTSNQCINCSRLDALCDVT